tara:strand:- start:413 stop:976 length:564 start_codon:yes stop_codon:yes gene_type:complete
MTTLINLADITPPPMVEPVCPCYGTHTDEYHLEKDCTFDYLDEVEMKTIDWVKRNETMIDFTVDRSNEPDTEPESDVDYTIEEVEWCGCLGEEGSGVCDDCDETNYDQELMEKVNVKENPVEPPLMVWDGNMKQSIVEVKCRSCKTIYEDTQCSNDCVSAYPYEYPKKGFYWMENKECYKCYKNSLE